MKEAQYFVSKVFRTKWIKIDDRVYNKMLYFHVAGNYGLFPANYVEIIDNKELQVM